MVQIEELKFDEKGLIPAIVVDALSQKVLTLAYMNKENENPPRPLLEMCGYPLPWPANHPMT